MKYYIPQNMTRASEWVKIIPSWVPANLITILRVVLLIPMYFAYQSSAFIWLLALFLLAWFTDIIDGQHARNRNQVSTLGKLLDPAVDKVFVVGLLIMVAPGRLSPLVVYSIIGLEIIIVLLTVAVAPISSFFFKVRIKLGANIFGKIKMSLQSLGLATLLLGINNSGFQLAAEYLFWCAALLAAMSIVFYLMSWEKIQQSP